MNVNASEPYCEDARATCVNNIFSNATCNCPGVSTPSGGPDIVCIGIYYFT